MKFGYFLMKVTGAGPQEREHWEQLDYADVALREDELRGPAGAEAVAGLSAWGDQRLSNHRGHYEVFLLYLASSDEEGCPYFILAEEHRLLVEGNRVDTMTVSDVRDRAAAAIALSTTRA